MSIPGEDLEGVWRGSGGGLEGVWRASGGGLEGGETPVSPACIAYVIAAPHSLDARPRPLPDGGVHVW
eukprot:6675463-Pyramimonas_sp.AAC.3